MLPWSSSHKWPHFLFITTHLAPQQPAHNFLATSLPLNYTVSICCTQCKYPFGPVFPDASVLPGHPVPMCMSSPRFPPGAPGPLNGFTCPFPREGRTPFGKLYSHEHCGVYILDCCTRLSLI